MRLSATLLLPSLALAALPPLNSIVGLTPTTDPAGGVRHCSFQLSTTNPVDPATSDDFAFTLVAGLAGGAGGVSFRSVNYATKYICPLAGHLGIGDIGSECASAADATWLPQAGLADASNFSFTSASANAAYAGLFLTQNASRTCACCSGKAGDWRDVVLAPAGRGTAQTFVVGHLPPPPPGPPATLVVRADLPVDHRIKREFLGCHSDPGYVQEPLGWNADLIYGNAFQPSPASTIPAWNALAPATAAGSCALTGAAMNPNRAVPSLACAYTGGTGLLGMANRGIGNEGFALAAQEYEGYLVVLAPAAVNVTVVLADRGSGGGGGGGGGGVVLASASLAVPASPDWQRVPFSLMPSAATACQGIAPGSDASIDCGRAGANPGHVCVRCGGEVQVGLAAPGAVSIGYVSLMPGLWGRVDGTSALRSTVEAMQEMGVSVIRQGGTVSQSFAWKEWRGPPWNRSSMGHTWGDSLVGSWGLFEMIDLCNAVGIKPVVTLAYDTNKAQDWADLVEYLYGDNTTEWGSLRIADGHQEPYYLDTMELGNEQENPDFVAQVAAMEAKRAQIGAPELFYMYPTNSGVSAAVAAQLTAIPLAAERVMPDCHQFINCETNAAISSMERAIQEASDLQTWFNVTSSLQARLHARTASFCTERSGHFDGYDQGLTFFLPNMTWLQPPGQVHAMITKTWVGGSALRTDSQGGTWLSASAQVSDDGATVVVQLVNPQNAQSGSVVTLSTPGFAPSGVVSVWTLQVPDTPPGQQVNKGAGNTPANPLYIAPVLTEARWPAGAPAFNVTLPPYSFTILQLHAA